MTIWLTVFVVLGPIFVVIAVLRNQKRLSQMRSATVELEVDVFGVRRVLADGRREGIDWLDVTEVEVLTAKSGPHAAAGGCVIVAGDEEHGCLVPIDQLQTSGLAEMLTHLPGFDGQRLMDAILVKPPSRVTCWARSTTQPD